MRPSEFLNLLYQMTRCAFLAQEKNSALGVLWHLINPLAMAGVLYVVFSRSATAAQTPHFGLFVFAGLIQFNFFANATQKTAFTMLTGRQLLLNTTVPPEVLVLQALAMESVTFACELVLVLVGVALAGNGLTWGTLSYVFVGAGILLLTLGVAFLIASFVILFTDLNYVWNLATRMLFFLTPIFYVPSMLGTPGAVLTALNPLAQLVLRGRRCLLDGQALGFGEIVLVLLIPGAIAAAGWFVFQRAKPILADYA